MRETSVISDERWMISLLVWRHFDVLFFLFFFRTVVGHRFGHRLLPYIRRSSWLRLRLEQLLLHPLLRTAPTALATLALL